MKPEESFIGQPIRSMQTMLRVLAEQNPDYISLVPDGIYGPETSAAVSNFQQSHGLPVTGVTNQETWDMITGEYENALTEMNNAEAVTISMDPNTVYCKGSSNPNIYLVQAMLTALSDVCESISPPGICGTLDDHTADSIASFQQLCGLPASGDLNKTTWKHLALQYPMATRLHSDSGTSSGQF